MLSALVILQGRKSAVSHWNYSKSHICCVYVM